MPKKIIREAQGNFTLIGENYCKKCHVSYRKIHKCVDSFQYTDKNGKTKST